MEKKKGRKLALKIVIGVLIGAAVLVGAYLLVMRYVILPKIGTELRNRGMDELAVLVEDNNEVGTIVQMTGVFADGGILDFINNMDKDGIKEAVGVLNDIAAEEGVEPEEQASSEQNTTVVQSPSDNSKPAETADDNKATTAYERISKAASKQEMDDGLRIISKLDMGYISSLLSGGLTREEKKELKKYIYQVLPKEDVKRAMQLYQKYKKYL